MVFSSWLCTNNTKNLLVKIVHPGGHVELHDRPIMAAEIMHRNPKCIVAHPNVFKQPWAVVAPDTMLSLGQKFYVVPVSTIRKLRRLNSAKNPRKVQSGMDKDEEENESRNSRSWKKANSPEKNRCFSDDNCLVSMITGSKVEGNNGDDSSSFSSSETKGLNCRKRSKDFSKGSPKKYVNMDNWQPSLESIVEEF